MVGHRSKWACHNFGHDKVMKVIDDTLIRYYSNDDTTTPSINIVEVFGNGS
jgi:hypothetical protein